MVSCVFWIWEDIQDERKCSDGNPEKIKIREKSEWKTEKETESNKYIKMCLWESAEEFIGWPRYRV